MPARAWHGTIHYWPWATCLTDFAKNRRRHRMRKKSERWHLPLGVVTTDLLHGLTENSGPLTRDFRQGAHDNETVK